MYLNLVTVRIGKRKDYQLNFVNPDPCQSSIPTYIIGYNGGQRTELIRLFSPTSETMKILKQNHEINLSNEKEIYAPILFQDDNGEGAVFIESIQIEEQNITCRLTQTPKPYKISKYGVENTHYQFIHVGSAADNYWRLTYNKNIVDIEKITITFQLEGAEQNEYKLLLCIAPVRQIRDIVVDFGSEASQMATFERDEIQTTNNIDNIFSNMTELLAQNENRTSEQKDRTQWSESNKLYKSIFFANQSFTGDTNNLSANTKCDKDEEILKMLTSKSEAQELQKKGYIVLPTVKLSGYGGIPQPKFQGAHSILNFNDYFFYRKCINNLLLSKFLTIQKINKRETLCLNVCLLVPNVFRPKIVSKFVQNLRVDIQKMIRTENLTDTIAAVEINTVSESDASLIGTLEYLESNISTPIGAGQYLIMDAGKGTLDISIIKYVGQHYVCRYRSGILGAGNALTFAYMCALLYDFLSFNNPKQISTYEIEAFINEKIRLDNDKYLISQMFDAVENFKKRENIQPSNNSDNRNSTKDLKSFTAFINQCIPLSSEAQKWVDATINEITNGILKELQVAQSDDFGKIDYIYYTGRAFRCRALKESIQAALENSGNGLISKSTIDLNDKILLKSPPENYDKLLCLFIRIAVNKGRCPDNTISLPFVRHQWTDKNDVDGVLDMVIGKFSSINTSPIITSRYTIPSSTLEELYSRSMRLGFELLLSPNDKLFYNGYNYRVENEKPISGKILLFMVNGDMYVRLANSAARRTEEETCFRFIEDVVDLKSSPLKFATFFPNVGEEYKVELIRPKEKEDTKDQKQTTISHHHDDTSAKGENDTQESVAYQFQ